MTRGRRKDLTIPPSRALIQQRDYRARKAKYLADLERRVRRAEDENIDLRLEVSELKRRLNQASGGSSFANNEVIDASAQLLQHLNETAASLSRFRSIAFKDPSGSTDGNASFTTSSSHHPGDAASSVIAMSRSLPSPTSSHDIPSSLATLPSSINPTESLGVRGRSASDSPSLPSSHADSRRPSASSEQSSFSTNISPYFPASSSSRACPPDPVSQIRPTPRVLTTLPPPRPSQLLRRDSYPTDLLSLPPLRLRTSEDDPYAHRTDHTMHRSHPYPRQAYESYASSSSLTPTTWSDLSRTGAQSRSSIPSHSEDEDGDDDDDEDDDEDDEDEDERYRHVRSRDDHDYTMHDDSHVPHSRLPPRSLSPSSSHQASTSNSSSRTR